MYLPCYIYILVWNKVPIISYPDWSNEAYNVHCMYCHIYFWRSSLSSTSSPSPRCFPVGATARLYTVRFQMSYLQYGYILEVQHNNIYVGGLGSIVGQLSDHFQIWQLFETELLVFIFTRFIFPRYFFIEISSFNTFIVPESYYPFTASTLARMKFTAVDNNAIHFEQLKMLI